MIGGRSQTGCRPPSPRGSEVRRPADRRDGLHSSTGDVPSQQRTPGGSTSASALDPRRQRSRAHDLLAHRGGCPSPATGAGTATARRASRVSFAARSRSASKRSARSNATKNVRKRCRSTGCPTSATRAAPRHQARARASRRAWADRSRSACTWQPTRTPACRNRASARARACRLRLERGLGRARTSRPRRSRSTCSPSIRLAERVLEERRAARVPRRGSRRRASGVPHRRRSR